MKVPVDIVASQACLGSAESRLATDFNWAMFVQNEIVEECLRFKAAALERLLVRGAQADPILRAEAALPGADNRLGVTLIARPPLALIRVLKDWQDAMRVIDDRQYFYPTKDLHLTLLAIGFELTPQQCEFTYRSCRKAIAELADMMRAPVLSPRVVSLDERAAAVHLVPADNSLATCRRLLAVELRRLGIEPIAPVCQSAHINFMRFLESDERSIAALARFIRTCRVPDLSWQVESLYLSAGSPRYGRRERTKQAGPFILSGAGARSAIVLPA